MKHQIFNLNLTQIWKPILWTFAAVWLLFTITFNLQIVLSNLKELGDFGSFLAAGLSLHEGTNPYGDTSPLIFEAQFPRVQAGGKLPNLNPPITAMLFEGVANMDTIWAVNLWRVISLVIYVLTVLVLALQYRPSIPRVVWMFALAGLWHTIGLGQLYTLLLLLTTLAWIGIQKQQDWLAGVCLGLLISIKPNFLIWLTCLLILARWRVLVASVLTILAISAIPMIAVGPDIYLEWLEAAKVGQPILAMPGNSSLTGLFSRFGYPGIGTIASAILVVSILAFLLRQRSRLSHDLTPLNSLGILMSLLASPIAWTGYTILTLPIFIARKQWTIPLVIAALFLTVPFNFTMHLYYLGSIHFLFWGWWYGIALVLVLADEIRRLSALNG